MNLSPEELGYEEASPSPTTPSPTCTATNSIPSPTELGYGEDEEVVVVPKATIPPIAPSPTTLLSRRRLRRMGSRASFGYASSFSRICGASEAPPSPPTYRRRTTMSHVPTTPLSSPLHHTLMPRRSSMTSATSTNHKIPLEPKPLRRVSFGGSHMNAINHVPKLHNDTWQEKKDMWYDTEELNAMKQRIRAVVYQSAELDESEDCWRGLETHIKKHYYGNSNRGGLRQRNAEQEKTCNQFIALMLQQKRKTTNSSSEEDEVRDDLRVPSNSSSDEDYCATRTGNKQAAEDEDEALAIYMETMDMEQVLACFESAKSVRACTSPTGSFDC